MKLVKSWEEYKSNWVAMFSAAVSTAGGSFWFVPLVPLFILFGSVCCTLGLQPSEED